MYLPPLDRSAAVLALDPPLNPQSGALLSSFLIGPRTANGPVRCSVDCDVLAAHYGVIDGCV